MNSEKIRLFTFDKGAFGFKTDEVEACLNDISDYALSLEKRVEELEKELVNYREKSERLESEEDSLKDILLNAQKLSSTVTEEAKVKAKVTIEKAEQRALSMTVEAEEKAQSLIDEATSKSHKMIGDATLKSEAMLKNSEEASLKENEILKRLQSEVSEFKSKLLSMYKAHLDIITKMPEIKKEKKVVSETKTTTQQPKAANEPTKVENQVEKPKEKIITAKPEAQARKVAEASTQVIDLNKQQGYKITIKENKEEPKETKENKETVKQTAKETAEDDRSSFKSRFGELQFGEHSK